MTARKGKVLPKARVQCVDELNCVNCDARVALLLAGRVGCVLALLGPTRRCSLFSTRGLARF